MTKYRPPGHDKDWETRVAEYAEHVNTVLAERYRRALELLAEPEKDES